MYNLQTGQETDFILVSCTGSGLEPTRREQVLKAKRVSSFFYSSTTTKLFFTFIHIGDIFKPQKFLFLCNVFSV